MEGVNEGGEELRATSSDKGKYYEMLDIYLSLLLSFDIK